MIATATGAKMKAIVVHKPGPVSGLKVEEIDRPAVTEDGVLVRVHASSANPVDLYALTPVAHMARGFKPGVLGTDMAGVVEAIGPAVTCFKPGDRVFGAARGAYAEYVCARQANVVALPAGMSFEDAGTLAVAGSTALQSVRDHGRLEKGQRILINGASGGVGTFLVQIARAYGGAVTAVCSTRHVELVRSLGPERVIDYTREDFVAMGDRYDLMLDVAGNRSWSEVKRVLRPAGTYVGIGAAALQHSKGGSFKAIGHFLGVRVRSLGSGLRVVALFIANLNNADLETLGDLIVSRRMTPVIERRFELSYMADALTYLNDGHSTGKVAIAIGG